MNASRASLLSLIALVLVVSGASQWWDGHVERRDGQRLAALAQPGDIKMLSSETCIYCESARHWLRSHAVHFEECFIERDAQCQALYQTTLARGTPTLLVRGKPQLGFDVRRVIGALETQRS